MRFHHHPDDLIIIEGPAGRYMEKPADFAKDLKAVLNMDYPGLPKGYIERFYKPGQRHYLATSHTTEPQEFPDPFYDNILNALSGLLAEQAIRTGGDLPPADPSMTPRQKRIAEYPHAWDVLEALIEAGLPVQRMTPALQTLLDKIETVQQKYPLG